MGRPTTRTHLSLLYMYHREVGVYEGVVGCHSCLKHPHLLFQDPIPLRFEQSWDPILAVGCIHPQ